MEENDTIAIKFLKGLLIVFVVPFALPFALLALVLAWPYIIGVLIGGDAWEATGGAATIGWWIVAAIVLHQILASTGAL